jgi:hypothetical protein
VSRPSDNPVPLEEGLFRALRPEDIHEDDVLFTAIETKGTSVNRAKYAPDPLSVLAGRELHVAVGATDGSQLSHPCVRSEPSILLAYAWDLPEEGVAHAEIRVRRPDDAPGSKCYAPGSKAAQQKLRTEIARRLKVVRERLAVLELLSKG